jgi:uncharacterized protein HemX
MNDEQALLLKKLNRRTRFTQFLAWLALFFTMVGIAAGYKNWLRIHDKAKAGIEGVAEIKSKLPNFAPKERLEALEKEINDTFKGNKVHLDAAMHELRNIQDSTQHIAETVYTQVEALTKQQEAVVKFQTPTIKDWSLGEVRFLLQTAVQRFNLNQDQAGAIEAFKLADTLLVERGELEFLPLRKQISQDIAIVNQYAIADKNTLSQKIDILLNQLKPTLKAKEKEVKVTELIQANETSEQQAPQNESLVSRVKNSINNAVIVRKEGKTLQTEMELEEKERLYQLLSLRLETLRMMLLQGDDKIYHQQANRIKALIKRYYPESTNGKLLEQLDFLDKANLKPILPDVSESFKLLEALMKKTTTTPATPATSTAITNTENTEKKDN